MIDKLYLILPEFKKSYDYKLARHDFEKVERLTKGIITSSNFSISEEDLENTDDAAFQAWFAENKDNYFIGFQKIKYDINKEPEDQTRAARNNMLLDMMWSVLTHPEMSSHILKPGGFTNIKIASKIVDLLSLGTEKVLELLRSNNIKLQDYSVIKTLRSLDLDTLNTLIDASQGRRTPVAISSQLYYQHQNMIGNLIGVYANNNVGHALFQATTAHLNNAAAITIYGKTLSNLHAIKDADGNIISFIMAGYGGASVDNAKDPCLAGLNQNDFTVNVSVLLTRLGLSPLQIAAFLRQPIIMDMVKEFKSNPNYKFKKKDVIGIVINRWSKKQHPQSNYKDIFVGNFTIDQMLRQIEIYDQAKREHKINKFFTKEMMDFYTTQVSIGYLFYKCFTSGELLFDVTMCMRAGTQKGAATSSLTGTMQRISRMNSFIENALSDEAEKTSQIEERVEKPAIIGLTDIYRENIVGEYNPNEDIKEAKKRWRRALRESKIPSEAAFYSLGVEAIQNLFGEYFPQVSTLCQRIIDTIEGNALRQLTEQERNKVYNEFFTYIMSSVSFYGEEEGKSSEEKRRYYLESFPQVFKNLKKIVPEIAQNAFIKQLRVMPLKAKGALATPVIIFKQSGRITSELQQSYRRAWEDLLYSDNPQVQELALNLAKYCFYRAGFSFSPTSFGHLMPLAIRNMIPGYKKVLGNILQQCKDMERQYKEDYNTPLPEVYRKFVDQFIYNNIAKVGLFSKPVPQESQGSFINIKEDKIQHEVTLNINENEKKWPFFVTGKKSSFGQVFYSYEPFIEVKKGARTYYYKLDYANSNFQERGFAVYKTFTSLGKLNHFLEYEYNKEVDEVKSVIRLNDPTYISFAEIDKENSDNSQPVTTTVPNTDDIDIETGTLEQAEDVSGINMQAINAGINGDPNAIAMINNNNQAEQATIDMIRNRQRTSEEQAELDALRAKMQAEKLSPHQEEKLNKIKETDDANDKHCK